eukprot:gene36332-54498_t
MRAASCRADVSLLAPPLLGVVLLAGLCRVAGACTVSGAPQGALGDCYEGNTTCRYIDLMEDWTGGVSAGADGCDLRIYAQEPGTWVVREWLTAGVTPSECGCRVTENMLCNNTVSPTARVDGHPLFPAPIVRVRCAPAAHCRVDVAPGGARRDMRASWMGLLYAVLWSA